MTFSNNLNFFYNELPTVKIKIGNKTDKFTDSDYLNNKERRIITNKK